MVAAGKALPGPTGTAGQAWHPNVTPVSSATRLDDTGTATLSVAALPNIGNNVISATYSGSTNFAGSLSGSMSVNATAGSIVVSTGGDVNSNDGSYYMSNSVTLADPNPASSSYVYVDFGDGSDYGSYSVSPNGSLVLQNQYQSAGTYTVTVDVTDDLEALGQATFNVNLS
jgi:hypothetical protein